METFSALLAICAGNSPVPVNSPHNGQWRGALMFTLICARINGWVNNREAGDLRRHRCHYDVIVMEKREQHLGLILLTWVNFNPCVDNMPSKAWDEITYPFPNFNGGTVEVWEWICNFIPHFIVYVITYPLWDYIKMERSSVRQQPHRDSLEDWETWWRHQMEAFFPCYLPSVLGIHRSAVNSLHKGQWRWALIFSLICAWINGWVNNCEGGDLRRHRTLCDITVMTCQIDRLQHQNNHITIAWRILCQWKKCCWISEAFCFGIRWDLNVHINIRKWSRVAHCQFYL